MRIAFSLVYDKPQVIVMSYMHMVSALDDRLANRGIFLNM